MSIERTLLASFLMLLSATATAYFTHAEPVTLTRPLSTFPMQIGEWAGRQERFDERVYDALGADDTLLGIYANQAGQHIQVFLSFYRSQKEGKQIHSPRNCMPGAGWAIVKSSRANVVNPNGNPGQVSVAKLILEKANEKQIMLYWFRSGSRYVSSEYALKLNLVLDSILRRRSDGMFIRLTSVVKSGDEETQLGYMKGFSELLLPLIEEYVQR